MDDFSKEAWVISYNSIRPKIPTILELFGEGWLDSKLDDLYEVATHQNKCHPLLSILLNSVNEQKGHEAIKIESIFKGLKLKIKSNKIATLKNATGWDTFIPEFMELILAHSLLQIGEVELEPETQQGSRPDMVLTIDRIEIGIEVNCIVQNDERSKSKVKSEGDLTDATKMASLVREYRLLRKENKPLTSKIKKKLKLIKEWDARWSEEVPRVFGGTPVLIPRYKNLSEATDDLIQRKKGSRQTLSYKYRLLALIITDEFFTFPYHFKEKSIVGDDLKYVYSGVVYHAFYGLKNAPLYEHHFIERSYVRERMKQNGRFKKPTSLSGAIIISVPTMHGLENALAVPIRFKSVIYEPLDKSGDLLPIEVREKIAKALEATEDLCVYASR